MRLGLGYQAKGSNYLFRRYDDALTRALKINQTQLDLAFKAGKQSLDNQILFAFAVSLFVIVSSYHGLLPRIEEYG